MRSLLKLLAAVVGTTALLAGCGGGSSGGSGTTTSGSGTSAPPVAPPTTVISSVFDGQTDSNQPITTFLLNDGSFFTVYSDPSAPQNFVGAIVGDGTVANGSLASASAYDIGLSGSGANTASAVSVSASYVEKTSLSGFVTNTATNVTTSFVGSYNSSYETLPALSSVAGTYTGTIATKDQVEAQIQLKVGADGALSGSLPCGCEITAKLLPGSDGTAYDATLAFTGGTHPFSGQSFAGNVYFDAATNRLYIVGKISGSGESAVFVGTRS